MHTYQLEPTRISSKPCEEWLLNRTVNPRSGRKIKVGGPTYRQLEQECSNPTTPESETTIREASTTAEPCEEWLLNRTVNPRSGRKIKVGGPTYRQLEKECSNPTTPEPETTIREASTTTIREASTTAEPCEEWILDRTVNPRSGRKIKVGGPTYRQLEQECSNPSSKPCEEWLLNRTVNPRSGRKIKVGGPIYRQLEQECSSPDPTTTSRRTPLTVDLDALRASSSRGRTEGSESAEWKCASELIEVVQVPRTTIRQTLSLTVFGDNELRYNSNEAHFLASASTVPTSRGYLKIGAKVFRNDERGPVINIFNPMTKHVPNFVYVFQNNTTEPYLDLDDGFKLNKALLFDLCIIQLVVYKYPTELKVVNPKVCLLKYDHPINDIVYVDRVAYRRERSDLRLCLTPDSYKLEGGVLRYEAHRQPYFLPTFLSELELDASVEHLVRYNRPDGHHNTCKLMRLLESPESPESQPLDNYFALPLRITPDKLYFNISADQTLSTNRNVALWLSQEGTLEQLFEDRTYSLPFNALFIPYFDPRQIKIDQHLKGPYTVLYNRHKMFQAVEKITFDNVIADVDPHFFKMFHPETRYVFRHCNIDMSDIVINPLSIQVYGTSPEYIFKSSIATIDRTVFLMHLIDPAVTRYVQINFEAESPNATINLAELPYFCNRVRRQKVFIYIEGYHSIFFPDSFETIDKLLTITFHNCNITSFHPSLFTSNWLRLNFEECALSQNSIDSLIQNIDNVPLERRPRIQFNMGVHVRNNTVPPIGQTLQLLFGSELIPLTNVSCEQHLAEWLARIYDDSTTGIIRQLLPHIREMLVEMDRNEEFMQESCNIIQDAMATCGDRMILSILYISLQFKMHLLVNELSRVREIASFLVRGPFVMSELEKIARAKIQTLYVVDQLEVYLAYPIKLRDYFDIPIETREMLYYASSALTNQDLDDAKHEVNAKLQDRELLANFLSTQPLWTKVVYSINPGIFEDVETLQDNLIAETKRVLSDLGSFP